MTIEVILVNERKSRLNCDITIKICYDFFHIGNSNLHSISQITADVAHSGADRNDGVAILARVNV